MSRRRAGAVTLGAAAAGITTLTSVQAAYAYNCVNVVLRDLYWSKFRHIVESGWNAAGIPHAFSRNGFRVDGVPSLGAVISWPAGQYGASSVGHVGVVTNVNDNGTVQILHENWPYGSAAHLQTFSVRPGMLFVHVPGQVETLAAEDPGPVLGPIPETDAT
ncbi:MAG: CHAP domain-containing protein [Chloroflexota bacterium]